MALPISVAAGGEEERRELHWRYATLDSGDGEKSPQVRTAGEAVRGANEVREQKKLDQF